MTTGVSIDRERMSNYSLTIRACLSDVTARDRCATNITQNLSIKVIDMNDNSPQFDKRSYHATLHGAESPGSRVIQVHAVDNDASTINSFITYHILSTTLPPARATSTSTLGGLFAVDALSGWLTVIDSLSDVDGDVTVTVAAEDHGDPVRSSMTTVHVSVTSQRPRITSPPDNVTILVDQVR